MKTVVVKFESRRNTNQNVYTIYSYVLSLHPNILVFKMFKALLNDMSFNLATVYYHQLNSHKCTCLKCQYEM